jgi:transcriptional regulator
MYQLPYFKEQNFETVLAFMKAHPFIVLSGVDADNKPVATQVPVLIQEQHGQITLRGHIMRQTAHHKAFIHNPNVLALFTGPHTYVSASWYSDPHQGSTWNYITVQAQGTVQFLDEDALRELLRQLTTHFEGAPNTPGAYDALADQYIQKLIKAIVAIEITVTQIENTFKLSQNRDEASYHRIIHELKQGSPDAQFIAGEMEQRIAQLFKQ